MLTKSKPDEQEEETSISNNEIVEEPCADDREKDLERRLAMLGTGETGESKEGEANLISFDPLAESTPTAAAIEDKSEPAAQSSAATKPNKSALLARIMAAQERAKQAQMKQASTSPAVQQQSTITLPTPDQLKIDAEQEKEKMMKALSGIADNNKMMEKETSIEDLKPPSIPPPQFMANDNDLKPPSLTSPPFSAPPAAMMPPPPSFEIFEQQQVKQPPPPPAFDTIENDIFGLPSVQAPSAPLPPSDESFLESFGGVTPMAPPPVSHEDNEAFDFDIDGNVMSPEEKRKMMEEQRAIMEQIQRQANENKASEAAVRANAFESRMTGNTNVFAPPIPAPVQTQTQLEGVTTAVDVGSYDPAEVEEQRRILEEIQKQVRKAQGDTVGEYQSPDVASTSSGTARSDTVDIGDGKKVALHGQEKTQEAIKDGTAILVKCLNCENLMQVTAAATLMFCPICSVVSPVLKQDDGFSTLEELRQMEEDRKLAERLQNEENAAAGNYPANRRTTNNTKTTKTTQPQEESWWDSLVAGMGVMLSPEESGKRSAEINVSRPPGSMTPSQRMLHGVRTGHEDEREGLLGRSGNSSPGSARVAESKPLFSCVVDSVTSAAAAAAAGVSSMAYGDDEEVNGIDTTSFLAVPKIGDERESSGSYSAIPNDE